jgi:hypothetical protein
MGSGNSKIKSNLRVGTRIKYKENNELATVRYIGK